ncbi:30S ribosomal protein S10 [Erythrobacter sp. NAP1]|nr:30S ribosomal protein S10 [Erythrobacter sp. NAP1]
MPPLAFMAPVWRDGGRSPSMLGGIQMSCGSFPTSGAIGGPNSQTSFTSCLMDGEIER